jgi:hypothetical protein
VLHSFVLFVVSRREKVSCFGGGLSRFFLIVFDVVLNVGESVASSSKNKKADSVKDFTFAPIDGESAEAENWR